MTLLTRIIVCIEQGTDNVALWAANVGNSWRTTHDIRDEWQSMINNIDFVRNTIFHLLHKYVVLSFFLEQ
jgi:hypothetical protein